MRVEPLNFHLTESLLHFNDKLLERWNLIILRSFRIENVHLLDF